MKDVFLSHASPDKNDVVRPFAERLTKIGISFWLDEAEIRWGQKLGKSINDGLQDSRYVVIFLSKDFAGRYWTEAELSAALTRENDEGRSVVLPVVIGVPNEVLKPYPLLRDKIYKKWADGIDSVVDSLRDLILADRPHRKVAVKIKGTPHTIEVDPGPIVLLLGKMDSHSVYPSKFYKDGLEGCGLLVECDEDSQSMTINGHGIEKVEPDFGKPAIWSLDFARLMWDLLMNRNPKISFYGRGKQYRQLVASLRHFLFDEELPEEFSKVGPA
jgi:hypothetical protein